MPNATPVDHLAASFDPPFFASHADKDWGTFEPRGLRPFFAYRDVGIGEATGGKWGGHLIQKIPGAKGTTGPHMHTGLTFQLVLVLDGSISFEYKGHKEIVDYKAGSMGYQNPGVYHEERGCSEDMTLLEIISPQQFGTVDLPSSAVLKESTSEGGAVSPSGDKFAVSHARSDGSDFIKRADGEYRDLPIAQATNNRCGSVISRGAKFRRGPAPFRFFLQVKGNSTISVAGELVEMQKGSALTVLGREVSVDNQGELFEVWEEPVKGSRL